jgi:lysophospholipase L1-like esterase
VKYVIYGAGTHFTEAVNKARELGANDGKIAVWDKNFEKIGNIGEFEVKKPFTDFDPGRTTVVVSVGNMRKYGFEIMSAFAEAGLYRVFFSHNYDRLNGRVLNWIKRLGEGGNRHFDHMFVGDSIIDFWDIPFRSVFNCGIRGIFSSFLTPYAAKAADVFKPGKIFILAGVNDLASGHMFSIEQALRGISRIAEICSEKSPRSDVRIVSLLPIDEREELRNRTNLHIQLLNKLLEDNADGWGFIDAHAYFLHGDKINPEYTDDGIHPNEKGYRLLGEILEQYMTR